MVYNSLNGVISFMIVIELEFVLGHDKRNN